MRDSDLASLERTVGFIDKDGTVVGKNVSAHRIAALIGGEMSADEVLRDYPNLTAAEVEAAVAYAKANPWRGRPYPPLTVKAALRAGRGGLAQAFKAARNRKGA
jgi:hypothetical protein